MLEASLILVLLIVKSSDPLSVLISIL